MAERPLYTLYKNLKAQNYDVPDDYNKFESALTRDGKGGADNRHAIYENLKAQNFDVPSTYERFYSALFEPRSKTSSRAKGGSVPMSAADRARFLAGAQSVLNTARQVKRASGNIRKTVERAKKFNANDGKVTIGFKNPLQNQNVQKNEFNYNSTTGKTGTYTTTDGVEFDNEYDASHYQNQLDKQGQQYINAVNAGEIPSAFDVRDKKGNYDLQENIGKNGTYLTEEGAQKQFDKKLADAYVRKKEIEALIAEDNRQHGNPLLSYGASIGASNGRTAEQSDYRNKLATSLALVTEQIGALEAVKQYPTSSWGEDALKALDNTAFNAKTWDFGLADFAIMGQMERIKTKMDNNIPLSGSDKMLLKSKLGADAATALEDEKMGNVYRWTKIAGQSLPFMADFFLTGGYGGITKGISRGALKFAAKRGMGKVGAAILKNTGIVAGDVIGSYAMAGTEQALKTGADIMQRHLGNLYQDEKGDYKFGTFDENGNLLHEGGESIGTALYKGMTSAMVENYTEKLFGHNYGIKKGAVNFMEKHGMNASAEFFKNIGKSGWYTNSKKWMEKFGINGFAEEVMEEEIGIPLHALLDGEGKVSDLLDAKQQLDIIGGMAISVGSMYAMGAGSRPVKGIYNRAQYYRFRNKVNVADSDAQNLMGDNWADIKDKIDNATNEQMGGVLADILRQRDTMTKEQINAAVNYGVNLMKMRGYNIAKTAEMNAKEITNEPTTPEEQHQADIDNAYSEGHDADDADKHDIQIQQEDQMKTLAAALGISEQQLSAMSDEELESLTGQDDKLDQAIYDYQLSSARYQGVVDDAQDKVDLAAHQAEQRVDMYTDQSRGSVRNATIKASGGLEDYGVYIISGNIATHDDGSIDVSNSDGMILYYDPTTNSVEHADALMFAELGEELPADDVKAQAVADAKENAIKEVAGIIDGTVEVGSQFNVTDTDGTEHTYEVLADYGDGTAAISIDGNVVENPYSLADLQQMKDLEDQKRLEAAKAEREQMEKERAAQQTQETEQTQPSFDFNQILNDNGNVVLVDVLDKDGNTKYPDSRLFLIRDAGAKAKVVELKSDGTIVPHAVNKEDVATISSMSLDEYKQAMPESSMIEDNSGENRGEIEVEAPTIEGETAAPTEETAAPESAETPETEQTPAAPAITLEDGTIVPMLEDGNPDFSKLTAAQTAELYDNQFGEDADSIVSGYVSDAKKALDKASNMTVRGKTFVEQKAAKDAKEKAIADAQAAYDSAIAIRDAYNERQLAKVEDTAEGRKELIEKARRKFARLKSAVKDDVEAVSQLYRDTIGSLLHRLYDGTGIDVTDTTPLTAEEYVASNLGAHSLNYEGTETSKGVKQETGLSREDFAKTQLLAADGKGTTIDALVHSLWENLPSNLESLDTQDIRNALIGVLNSGFKASEARNFVENIRIAQAENILEEQKRAQENAAYAEQHKAEPEAELKAKSDEKAELKAKSEAKLDNESDNESNDLSNETDNEQKNDNINDNINVPEDATDEAPLGAERDESDLPFSAKENGKQKTTAERAADVEKNKVDDMKVVDNIVGEKTRKTLEKLAKMMGANVQWQYSDKNANGWFDDKTNTIYLTLDSSITECVQFIFGHEMTHEMRTKNPAAYDELKTLVKDMMGEDAFNKETDRITSLYNENNVFYNGGRTAYEEEVVADQLGSWIRDANYAHTLLLKMSHPLLARLHEIVNRFLMALHGTEFSDDMNLILRSIEQAYVKTANGQVTNSETGEDVSFSLRQKPEPKKKGIGYKVFVLKDGKLYPPMVANPDGAATPVGVWLDADAAPIAGESKTGRPQVKQGGKGTQGGSGKLAYRPGWHLGIVPYAIQFNRKDAEGNKTLFPKNFVFAEVEYAADVDYQEEARQEGINPSGKYQHSLAGLKHLPTDGYYMYRTNPNPETDPWVITGAMKVNRILTRAEQAELVKNAGREPQQIQEGDIVTDDVVNSINQEIADAPKFSLKDNQENPLNQDGTLKLDKIKSVDELTDEDFTSAFRNVELPAIPKNVDAAIGANGKPIVIKKNIFEKNWNAHKFTPAESKKVLNDALYNTDLVGHTQPTKKPNHWVAIKLDDKSPITVLEVNDNKNNVEVVGWYTLDERNLGRIKRQAERNGGELIMLTPKDDKVESLSTPPLSSAANIINSFETTKENGEKVDVEGTKFSLKDEEYLKAVEDGNMEKAQKMVNEAADAAGYSTDSSYQGTSAFNGAAPWGNGYFLTKDERKEAWDNGEFEGESTLGDYINDDIDGGNLEELTNAASYRAADPMRKEAIDNVRNAIQKKAKTITMYRSVPSDVKEGSFRNGDWVTPSRAYAVDNAKLHGWGDDYNIIEQKVPVDDVWFDGNDIAEWGYGREEDYINDTDFAYKNSKNNKKLLDAVTYDDNGNVIPLSQRFNEKNKDVRFSLKDEKTLAGVHNITEEKLRKALKLGGFANPSLAVIDTNKTGHDNFGEISFIAPSALLDKRTGNTGGTWITDAYTQRYPSVEREMSEKGYRKFEDWVDSLDYPSGAKAEIERQAKDALSDNNAPAWELMYLKEKGIDIKEYDSRIDYRWKEIISDHPTAEDILNSMKTDPELNEKVTSLAKHAIIHPTWEKVSLEVRRKMYKETGVKASPINPQVRKQTKEIFERDYAPTLLNKDGSPRKKDVKKVVEDIVKEHNDTKKYDFYLSKVKASNYVNKNGLYDDYIRWQENKLDEFGTKNRIFRGYTRDGSRKYVPETLENVSKAMREEADGQTNGSEYTSFGSFIAKLASRVDSTDEMRANKDKLSSNKDKEEFYEKWSDVYYDLAKFLYNDVFYGEQRLHDIVLQSDPKKYAKKEYGITLTPTFMKKLDALKNAVQTELKSAYFETKYNRPLRLNEFAAAVVPDNLGKDVRKGIENAGLPMYDYDPNKEGDRSRAFNEAINSSDNIRFSLAGERGAAAADKAEERTFRMDNLSVAKDMEKNKKKAKAIKAATGWERGADGKWRYEMPDVVLRDPKEWVNNKTLTLSDIVEKPNDLFKEYPELFDAYPKLKDVKIQKGRAKMGGSYYDNTITLNLGGIREAIKYDLDIHYKIATRLLKRTLVHEVQHYIQHEEGFAKGGSEQFVRDAIKDEFEKVIKQIRGLRAEGKEDEAKALAERNKALYNAYANEKDSYKNYKSLSGEVEARNVSARLNMTPEERRKTLAESTEDVARKDQIFLGVGDVSFSLRDMADGKESGAADMAEDLKSLNTPDEVDDAIKTAIEDMPSGWKMANKKMIHIAQALGENRKAEIAGEEPKFSLKDGTLIKAGTYFSGGGLVEEGLKGIIDPVVAVEYDEKISGVYRNNFGQHIVTADVRDVDPKELVKQIDGEVEYFHASPVCKNYSQAKSNHAEVELDKETAASTAEFINAVKPKVVTIENVKGYKDSEAMKIITDALDANGYTWDADVYNAADYGGYTNRERLIVRAIRDGKLPEKPKKMAHKSGWYEAVADIIPTLTEKKNGVANWMDVRLKADGIDWRNIDKPLYVMGSAYADGKVPHAFADELLPTLRTKSGDVIVMPDGKVYRAMGRVLARVSGVSDDYKMPFSENLSHTIIGNGIPTQLTEHVIAPLLTGSDPKFSIRTYHGTGASFDKFDLSHALEGEGSESFGHGVYVTNSRKIGREYAQRAKQRKMADLYKNMRYPDGVKGDIFKRRVFGEMVNDVATGGSVASAKDFAKKRVGADANDIQRTLENLKDREKGTEYEQNLKDRLAEYKEGLKWIDSLDEDYLTQGNANRYDVDIPDDNGDYLDWENKLKKSHLNKVNKELVRIGKEPIETIYPSRVDGKVRGQDLYDELSSMLGSKEAASKLLSDAGFVGIKYPAGTIFGGAKKDDYNYVIFDENNANIVGNTRFSLRYDKFEHDLNQWKKDNNLPKDAQRPTIPQRNAGESAVDFLRRVDEYRKQMALWKTAPTYEQHLLSDDTALGEFNRELQRGSVLKRIAFQDSMLAIRKAQEAIMKEVGVDRLNMAEDAYTAENRSHGKGKNEFEEYNNEFLQPLRKAYHQMKKILGDSYDNVRIYMMAKHGLERDAQMAFKKSLDADFEDVAQRSAAYKAYKGDMNRIINDSDLEFGRVDFTTWRQRDNALRAKYSPSYMNYRYDKNGIAYDYSGLSALFDGSDFEEAAYKLVKDIEDKYVTETHNLWDATNAATKKILRDGYKAGMMSKDTYQYVRDMYSHYIPLRGWDGTTADQVWDYIGGGKGAFNQTLKKAHGRTSIADDPIAYIENMAESGILLNNKNWVKQHLMLLAQNHPTSLLTLSKAWYVKSTDANGNEEWIPATPQISSQMNSNQVKAAIDAFEKKMEQMAQAGDATQKRDGLNIAYPQTHSEEREHEVRVMKDGDEYVIYVNGDPQLAQAMNNTRAHRVREIQSGKLDRAAAWLGRKMAAAYTSLSPLFIPSNYFRDLTMTLASTAIREDGRYNYLLRKNLATSWNLGFMLRDYQNGKLRDKVNNGNATPKEQMFYDFMMNGGETGFVSSLDVEDLKKKFKNDLKDLDRWKTNPVKVGHTIMDGIEFLNRAIEDSNRFAVYMTSIQYGRSIDEAVNDAKDVTLNFNRKGTGEYGWQMIRNLYLFINPAVQSLQTLGALAKHHPFKFTAVTASWLASGVLVPIVNAALMSMLGGDDDKDKYWQFTKWDRRNNLIMWVPYTHEYVKIPLAQEFRAFYGIGDMIASKMMGGELAEESWSQYAEDLLGQVVDMLPLDPTGYDGNIAVSLMPNAIRPVFELAFNVDFTGKPLFKETEYNKYDPNFTKAYVGTPDWLVRASKMVNSIGNDYPDVQQNSIDAFGDPRYNLNNPAVVDHVLSSYLGGAYTMGSQVLGLLTKSLNDPKEIKVADIPLFSKFVSNPDDRPVTKKQGDEFWNMKENHDRAANTLSKLKKQANVDGDYSMLERFYGSEEYKKYKQDDVKVKKYEEDKKKERAEDSGEEYRPHKLNAEDIYKAHATPKDDFEDLKLKQLYTKLNGFKTSYDLLVDTAPSQSDGYYNNNKAAIDAIDEISLDKQEISELKKGFLDDGKDAYNAEDMKQIRDLRKKILSVLEKANKVVVANQKAKAKK
jgi:site-specific DNA-cytosine methylase